jgi:hypothetical protein
MEETTIEQIMEKAMKLQKQRKRWHFHMLTPDCIFNKHKDKHAFVLENETDSQSFVNYSDKRYMKQGKILVKMLHGNEIISDKTLKQKGDGNIDTIIERAKELNKRGIHWHHHMFFPDCVFNKNKGKWCIIFEDKETGEVIESVSEGEPRENLGRIEALFYAQKE